MAYLDPGATVFISSPYTLGDTAKNVRRQHDAFKALIDLGHVPFAPLLSHYQELVHPMDYEQWLKWDLVWLEKCDAVLRLPGESSGADKECAHADDLNIPVIKYELPLIKFLVEDPVVQFEPVQVLVNLLEAV